MFLSLSASLLEVLPLKIHAVIMYKFNSMILPIGISEQLVCYFTQNILFDNQKYLYIHIQTHNYHDYYCVRILTRLILVCYHSFWGSCVLKYLVVVL